MALLFGPGLNLSRGTKSSQYMGIFFWREKSYCRINYTAAAEGTKKKLRNYSNVNFWEVRPCISKQ